MYNEPIDVWRMSASRPWQLKETHGPLVEHLKYRGELRYHLIESVLQPGYSKECIEFGKNNGYKVYIIDPAKEQGDAIDLAINEAIKSKYSLKWEDDFLPEVDIPLDNCVDLMEKHQHINQICFNKRETMKYKKHTNRKGEVYNWHKEQRIFELDDGRSVPLVVKEKWWFGSAIWRMDYIRKHWVNYHRNVHNLLNDNVLIPLAGGGTNNQPSQENIEKYIGCYIYGKTGDKRMVLHNAKSDSIWNGELLKRWTNEGKRITKR
jgi:hypothetical protein